jgi:hypothetical protein
MTDYSRHKINGLHSLQSLIADIMIHDGPDGHTDGCDIIAKEIWKRIKTWKPDNQNQERSLE